MYVMYVYVYECTFKRSHTIAFRLRRGQYNNIAYICFQINIDLLYIEQPNHDWIRMQFNH